jgi:hypothetical protein
MTDITTFPIPTEVFPFVTRTAATLTNAGLTSEAGTHYLIDASGLTADRNFILPSGADGDEISFELVTDAPADYELVILGDAGVSARVRNAAAVTATEVARCFVIGESMRFVHNGTDWVCNARDDGRIDEQTAISSTSAEHVFRIVDPARTYRLDAKEILTDSDLDALLIAVSTDGGSTYVSSGYTTQWDGASVNLESSEQTTLTTGLRIINGLGAVDGEQASCVLWLFGLSNPDDGLLHGFWGHDNITPTMYVANVFGRVRGTTSPVTHIKVLLGTGNMVTGEFRLARQ